MRRLDGIAEALGAHASRLDDLGAGRFEVVLQNGTRLAATATVDDGWLVLEAPLDDELPDPHAAGAGEDLWALLGAQAALGAARVVLCPGADGVRLGLRAEIALDDEVDLGRRVAEACTALHRVGRRVADAGVRTAPEITDVPSEDVGTVDAGLAALVRATGWPVVERSGGRLAVELKAPGMFRQALVDVCPDGNLCASLPLATDDEDAATPISSTCRAALGLFLLRAGSVLRLVRPSGDVGAARFEVALGEAPVAAEVGHALAALSTAARLTLREAAVLRADADIATAYLASTRRRSRRPNP
jgi:hypothetical protein